MSPAAGTILGQYEICSPLGAGGMGEVYRAHDTRLDRDVAIKVLPEYVSSDPERLRRFEQEARATAALNHPNILAVYQMATQDGVSYLVEELLDGETLRERLRRGPIPLRKAIDYSGQIAHGLAAAHDKGIVHRDLKPENLFVTKDGRVKILDFGLAKVHAKPAAAADGRTVTIEEQTDPGTVLGTVGYMSPEQVRGENADSRSDIFALGTILYEMLTGKTAFRKPTKADTISAILNEEPPSLSQVSASTPPGLQRVVHRCLEKNPEQRFHSSHDLAFALEALSDSSSPSVSAVQGATRKRWWWPAAVIVALILAAIGSAIYWSLNQRKTIPFENFTATQITYSGKVTVTAISPDGKLIASAEGSPTTGQRLWLHNVATNSNVQISDPEDVGYGCLDFSPDGNFLYMCKALRGGERDLFRVPVLGGSPQRIVRNIGSNVSTSQDGKRIGYLRRNCPEPGNWCLAVADADGNGERTLFSQSGINRPDDYDWPQSSQVTWSPDQKQVAVAIARPGKELGEIAVVDVQSGRQSTILSIEDKLIRSLFWMPDGRNFLVNYALRTSSHQWQVGSISYPNGTFRPITRDTNSYWVDAISTSGRALAAVQSTTNRNLYLLPAAGSQNPSPPPLPVPLQELHTFSWDADGRVFLSGDGKLVRVNTSGAGEAALLNEPGPLQIRAPSVCDGGRYLVFEWDYRHGTHNVSVWRANADGSNLLQLTTGADGEDPVCPAVDKWVYYVDGTKTQPMRISIEGGEAEPVPGSSVPNGQFAWGNIALSPDGKQLAYLAFVKNPATQALEYKAVIVGLDNGPVQEPQVIAVDSNIGYPPQFTPNGKALAYPIFKDGVTNLWLQPLDGSPWKQLTSFSADDSIRMFYWSPDGKTLGVLRQKTDSNIVLLHESSPSSQ